MNSILEDLFKEKIDIIETLPFKKREPTPDEKHFINTLSTEQQEIYKLIMEYHIQENQDCFMAGFKMAINTILELLTNTDDEKLLI